MRQLGRLLLVLAIMVVTVPVIGAATPEPNSSGENDEVLVILEERGVAGDSFDVVSSLQSVQETVDIRRADAFTIDVEDAAQTEGIAQALDALPEVAAAAALPRGTVRTLGAVPPNDTIYSNQQTYLGPTGPDPHSINIEGVWDAVFNGSDHAMVPYRSGVTVAVIDTGVSSTLRETTGEYVDGYDYAYEDEDTEDVYGHGTQVASIIRAQENNSYGISGVLHESTNTVVVYKTIRDNGTGDAADTILALMDAADRGAKVINASLGDMAVIDAPSGPLDRTYDLSPDTEVRALWDEAVDYCTSKGSLVVASAGNKASTTYYHGDKYTDLWYPAASPNALSVGAIDPSTGLRWADSCYGPELDLVAAGKGIWLITTSDSTARGDGTSYSAPLVSGAAALLWSLVPDASATTIKSMLTQTAIDYPLAAPDGKDDEYGHGRLDAAAGYAWMKANLPHQSSVSVSASDLDRREVQVSWTAAAGSSVFYRYGVDGGPEYQTTATSGRLVLPADGSQDVYVRSFARDRWGAQTPGTVSVSPSTGRAILSAERLDGANRYATSASVSRRSHPSGASSVVVASGSNWPDALSASVLAKTISGPLLLTRGNTLPIDTRDELVRLSPTEVLIIGGEGAVEPDVADSIRGVLPAATVSRIGGSDRYHTAELVAAEVADRSGPIPDSRAVIASGQNYPDALAGAPMAASAGWPILLTRTTVVPGSTLRAISELGVDNVLVLGGDGAVAGSARGMLPTLAAPPLAGADRYATARAIADYSRSQGILPGSTIGLATGRSYPDALSAGPYLASTGAPAILADSLSWGLDQWLKSRGDSVTGVSIMGGDGAVARDLEFDIRNSLRD